MKDDPIYKAALKVITHWDNRTSMDNVAKAINELKLAVMAENRMSWTDDYYNLENNKDGKK